MDSNYDSEDDTYGHSLRAEQSASIYSPTSVTESNQKGDADQSVNTSRANPSQSGQTSRSKYHPWLRHPPIHPATADSLRSRKNGGQGTDSNVGLATLGSIEGPFVMEKHPEGTSLIFKGENPGDGSLVEIEYKPNGAYTVKYADAYTKTEAEGGKREDGSFFGGVEKPSDVKFQCTYKGVAPE